MQHKSLVAASLTLILIIIASIGFVRAQAPEPDDVAAPQAVLGTAFTYQGRLTSSGAPVNGNCDFQFSLFDAASAGTQIGATQTASNISVSNGLFTVALDFGGGAFNGEARWLQIGVRCPAGSGSYTTLSPRQALTPAPHALALPGLWTRQNAVSPNLIGGHHANQVTANVVGATIGGGGESPSFLNRVTDNYSTVGGGADNQAGNNDGNVLNAPFATVGGGRSNIASGIRSTVGGGFQNTAGGDSATVGGGFGNVIAPNAPAATIPGGYGARATHYGELAYASGMFANPGDAQSSLYVLRNQTTSASWTNLYLDGVGGANQITIAPGRTVSFEILVAARDNSGNSAGYRFEGVVENLGPGAVLLTPTGSVLHEDVAAWDAQLITSGNALVIQVQGGTSASPARWVAMVRTAEVGWLP